MDIEPTEGGQQTRRQQDWIRKCVLNFSLYTDLISDRVSDPLTEADFKPKLSKSAKKRMRKMKKKKLKVVNSVQVKKLERILKMKRKKKDMKLVINKLSRMPL